MILKCLFMTIVIVLLSNTAFGDGPPMDKNGNITEDHTVIILNEEQLDQVGKFRVLTLTDKQHEHLKKIVLFSRKKYGL